MVPAIILTALLVFPLVVRDNYYQHLMILVLMWIVIGSGWNLLWEGSRPRDRERFRLYRRQS